MIQATYQFKGAWELYFAISVAMEPLFIIYREFFWV